MQRKFYIVDLINRNFVHFLGIAGYDPKKGRPRLAAWMEKVAKETSPHYENAHKFVNQMAKAADSQQVNFKL